MVSMTRVNLGTSGMIGLQVSAKTDEAEEYEGARGLECFGYPSNPPAPLGANSL